ncbi:MAG: SgcJ/EcaC family oxidoreductase [Vicinamibacterales bacterium]
MDRRRIGMVVAVISLAAVVGACGPEPPREFGKADIDAINTLMADFVTAYNAKDANKVANMFSGTGMVMPANASALRGFEPVRGYFENRFAEGATDLEMEARDVSGHGPLAYVTGTYTLHMKPADGTDTKDRGKILWVTKNLGGQWKLEIHAWSSDFPPPEPAPEPAADEAAKTKK